MQTFLLVVHIVLSFVIVVAILLQSGKGGGLGAGFGGAAAVGQEIFGGRGAATFLGKLTVLLGAGFMITSISLAWFSSKPQSVLDLTTGGGAASQAQVHQIIEMGSGPMPEVGEELSAPLAPEIEPVAPAEIPPEILEQLQRQLDEIDEEEGALELPEIPDPVELEVPPAPVPSPPPETQPEVSEPEEASAPAPAPEPEPAAEPTPETAPEPDEPDEE
jgi:preprotein translocase subunit SecG